MEKPFLSVIISCHNSEPYIRKVLNSLVVQDFPDLEIIISEDASTDHYLDIVKTYEQILNIKIFPTDEHKYHCPGNTRHDGWRHATGEWITFMDHDDTFNPNAFNLVKKFILENNNDPDIVMVRTPIDRADTDGNSIKQLSATTWLHGKFYRADFIKENDINFKVDLFGNEDLYFNNLMMGHITGKNKKILDISMPMYKWYANPESLSNKREIECEGLGYTEKYFGDYIISNSIPHIICYEKYPEYRAHFELELLQTLILSYFYYERAYYIYPDKDLLIPMEKEIRQIIAKVRTTLDITLDDIINWCYTDVDRYNSFRLTIQDLSGPFIETHSTLDFFKMFDITIPQDFAKNKGKVKSLHKKKSELN